MTADPGGCDTCTRLWNDVALTSAGWQLAETNLRGALVAAHAHGITTPDLSAASGLDEARVTRILEEGSL